MRLAFYFTKIEIFKILKRRFQLILLLLTTIGYPILINVYITISLEENLSNGDVAGSVIMLTTSIIFLPLWVTIFVGQEFAMSYVARFALTHSRSQYFLSKIIYCFLISTYFTVLTFVTLLVSLNGDSSFFGGLVPQLWITYTLYSILSLCIVFLVRTPILSTVLVYFLPQLDNIIFMVGIKVFNNRIRLGPFEVIRTLYSESTEGFRVSYSNLFFSDPLSIFLPIVYVLIITLISYRYFLARDLKMMSE